MALWPHFFIGGSGGNKMRGGLAIGVSLSTAGSGRMPVTAVIAGDPSRAWLFRVVSPPSLGDGSRGFAIEHRPMSCHFDPAATVPDRLLSQPGMSVTAPP